MSKSLIGIDVNSVEIKVANAAGRVHYETLPDNVVDNMGVISPESELLPGFIKVMMKGSGIKAGDCAIVLPASGAYYKTIDCPVMTDEKIKLNLPYEFKNYVGTDPQNYWYDYYVDEVVNDENGNPESLHLVAAAGLKSTMEGFATSFRKAGLNLTLALPREVCLINLMKKADTEGKGFCLIGMEYDSTSIYLFNGKNLEATKLVDYGTRDIDKIICKTYDVDEATAVRYRDANQDDCLNNPALTDIYDRVALEVMKTINFYRYEHSDSDIKTAYFFDASAFNNTLNEAICKQAGFEMGDIKDILPGSFAKDDNSARVLYSIGLVLSEVK